MFRYPKTFDVIVVGAGHAGIEAALATSRMGCSTLLLSINLDTIGQMSCNPAIGGLAKGHLVREIDALGGEMGKATDLAGIQFRMLNRGKGPSVWAPRAQCDKKAYQFGMKWTCERQANLELHQAHTAKILHSGGTAVGVETTLGLQYYASAVVITTGTFLRGLMHVGEARSAGGRAGEAEARHLSASLSDLGIELGRLKTGTPPRLLAASIDFSKLEVQPGEEPVPWFSHWNEELFHVEQPPNQRAVGSGATGPLRRLPGSVLARVGDQLPCHITHTTPETAELIRANLHRSPMYSGIIEGVGPRYCPSIEDKVVRFADKESHQIFLEPEGIATGEIYVNGFSTSLPYDVQIQLVRTIIGCENAQIMRPAYAVEYDFAYPTQLSPSLETKACQRLFLAGQINGTSGYEEAAAQGLIAGINAARSIRGEAPIVLRRDQSYIGVLIDDLVTKGTNEPYRMFTSRAEYRLLLRQDNADLRLSEIGFELGLLSADRIQKVRRKAEAIQAELRRLETTRVSGFTLAQLLRRPEVTYKELPNYRDDLGADICCQVEHEVKYAGYIERQRNEAGRFKALESHQIPEWLDYARIPSLRTEARIKLAKIKPTTLGQAARISGITPADVTLVSVWIKRGATAFESAARNERGASGQNK